jgi:hypothetical protein
MNPVPRCHAKAYRHMRRKDWFDLDLEFRKSPQIARNSR